MLGVMPTVDLTADLPQGRGGGRFLDVWGELGPLRAGIGTGLAGFTVALCALASVVKL
jgi:hypothetical protein